MFEGSLWGHEQQNLKYYCHLQYIFIIFHRLTTFFYISLSLMFLILLVTVLQNSNYAGMTSWFSMKWSFFFCNNIFNTLLLYLLYCDCFWNSIHWVWNTVKILIYEDIIKNTSIQCPNVFKTEQKRFCHCCSISVLRFTFVIQKMLMLTSVNH